MMLSLKDIGLYVRGGSILPLRMRDEPRKSSADTLKEPLKLMIFCKPSPKGGCDIATGDLYLDDGSTLDQRYLLFHFQQK